MKKIIWRYGVISVVVLVVTGLINFMISGKGKSYANQEVLGYVSIFLSTIFAYFGIKQYRDKVNGGVISYGKAMQVGVLIILMPSVAFGIFDVIYVKYMDPGFMEKYYSQYIEKIKASTPPDKLAEALANAESQRAMFSNTFMQFALMASTVLMIGLVVCAISALVLQKKPKAQIA